MPLASVQAQTSRSAQLLSTVNPSVLPKQGIPAGLIHDEQNSRYLFWAELGAGKLHLLERKETGLYFSRSSVPISMGKAGFGKEVEGDLKTPVGVYKITSFLGDDQLTDKYGAGAYPLNYPNNWDRVKKRTGHGIWLHGLPKGVDERPLLDSDGCVVVSNPVLDEFNSYIRTGESTFVLAEKLEWLPPEAKQPADDILQALDAWRSDWAANNNKAYLSHYHENFNDTKKNLAQWKRYKTRVNASKRRIRVKLSQLTVIEYPGEDNLVSSRFYQDYKSNNFSWHGWKQLLWRRAENGEWKILYEGSG